jgi:putative ABC transport system permease protein
MVPGMGDLATTIAIKIEDGESEEAVIQRLKKNDITGTFYTWKEVTGLMQSVSDSFLSINVLMTTVGMLIAAVTIFIIIYVNIVNKRKQIGILRAIGIKSYIIVFSYVILSAFYSVLGVIVGSLIFIAVVMPYFQAHPFVLPICDAVLVLEKTDYIARAEAIMWVSALAGLIPAAFVVRGKMLNAILGK